MEWSEAKAALGKLNVGVCVNTTRSTYRQIISKSENDFQVRVGNSASAFITVTDEMLKNCFVALSQEAGYSRNFFKVYYSQKCKSKPCFVHVIGQLFVKAGIAVQDQTGYRYFMRDLK